MSEFVLAVSDANVIIDIEDGGLTNSMFSIPNTLFCVPDVLFDKELKENHSHLETLGLEICTLSGTSVEEIYQLAQKYQKVSRLDLFALQLAKKKSALLLKSIEENISFLSVSDQLKSYSKAYVKEWGKQDLNLRPTDYESAALTD